MSLVSIDWRPAPAALRKFGLTLIVGFGLIGAAFWFGWPVSENHRLAIGLWIGGGVAGFLGLTGTAAAYVAYWPWMGFAFVMGNVMSRVVLFCFYFLFLTPFGLMLRALGRDRLALRKRPLETYWVDLDLPEDPERFERQF